MTYSIRMPKRGDTRLKPVPCQATTMTTDDATKTLNLTAFLAEQRPRTVGKAVAPKPGLNTEVISPDGSRFDLTGPHRCSTNVDDPLLKARTGWLGLSKQDTSYSADDEPRGGSKASLNVFLAPRVQK
uniref:Uncharacterized protein n=1 Tax=Trichuris muris TaxID=70415 RepID=A0A5S6QN47_TRIMR